MDTKKHYPDQKKTSGPICRETFLLGAFNPSEKYYSNVIISIHFPEIGVPSKELTCPTWGKRTSSLKVQAGKRIMLVPRVKNVKPSLKPKPPGNSACWWPFLGWWKQQRRPLPKRRASQCPTRIGDEVWSKGWGRFTWRRASWWLNFNRFEKYANVKLDHLFFQGSGWT